MLDTRAAILEKMGVLEEALKGCRKVIDVAPSAWQVGGSSPISMVYILSLMKGVCSSSANIFKVEETGVESDDGGPCLRTDVNGRQWPSTPC